MITDAQTDLIYHYVVAYVLEKDVEEHYAALEAEFARLNARVEHLTALVKLAEWSNEDSYCPWCGHWDRDPHADDCPAFTPGGDVK